MSTWPAAAVPAGYLTPGTGSLTEFLARTEPQLLPWHEPQRWQGEVAAPHGTTIVGLTWAEGVVIAGDRRATMGSVIAQRDIDKVFVTDEYSAVGIAGTAGIAIELVKLFQLELEHYEKIEGVRLSLDGKANRLATMIRGNLGMAMQGLAVVPLFAGFDPRYVGNPEQPTAGPGRLFSYDVAGGRYEEYSYHAVGSGSIFARSALKKRHNPAADRASALTAAVEALYDAADDDSATGGPDLTRRIFPTMVVISAQGAVRVPQTEVEEISRAVVAGRVINPGG